MPVYEYCCNICNIQFELRQKFSDPPADKCPTCGGTVRKIVSAASFSLKGAGWYGDGYGTKAEPPQSESDSTAGSAGAREAVPTETAPTEITAAAPATQAATPPPVAVKSTAVETTTPPQKRTEVTSAPSSGV